MVSTLADKRPNTLFKPCPDCGHSIEYWFTSGMSECFPHFYCDRCSSILWRREDRDQLTSPVADEAFLLEKIISRLPGHRCGGQFKAGVGPRCPKCHHEFRREGPLEYQARSPNAILVEGAELLTES
ncbi:MAG: hypothetical protein QM754_07805 [Tepidisphaeraceae bacterium]